MVLGNEYGRSQEVKTRLQSALTLSEIMWYWEMNMAEAKKSKTDCKVHSPCLRLCSGGHPYIGDPRFSD
jgi:hypothetical protein